MLINHITINEYKPLILYLSMIYIYNLNAFFYFMNINSKGKFLEVFFSQIYSD